MAIYSHDKQCFYLNFLLSRTSRKEVYAYALSRNVMKGYLTVLYLCMAFVAWVCVKNIAMISKVGLHVTPSELKTLGFLFLYGSAPIILLGIFSPLLKKKKVVLATLPLCIHHSVIFSLTFLFSFSNASLALTYFIVQSASSNMMVYIGLLFAFTATVFSLCSVVKIANDKRL